MTAPIRPPADWPTGSLRKWLLGSTIAGSTQAVDVVDHSLRVQQARQDAARDSARRHTERVRKGIRMAAGALPVQAPGWPVAVASRIAFNPAKYGLTKVPCDDVIRAEWELLKK